MESIVYDGDNFSKVQERLGERPGDYAIDKYYLREGWAHKPFFWESVRGKWLRVSIGDMFYEEEGVIKKTGSR